LRKRSGATVQPWRTPLRTWNHSECTPSDSTQLHVPVYSSCVCLLHNNLICSVVEYACLVWHPCLSKGYWMSRRVLSKAVGPILYIHWDTKEIWPRLLRLPLWFDSTKHPQRNETVKVSTLLFIDFCMWPISNYFAVSSFC